MLKIYWATAQGRKHAKGELLKAAEKEASCVQGRFCAVMRSEPFQRPCSSGLTSGNHSKTLIDVATDMSIRAPYRKAASTVSQSSLCSVSSKS